jgi:hypothetical protein
MLNILIYDLSCFSVRVRILSLFYLKLFVVYVKSVILCICLYDYALLNRKNYI